MTDQDWSLVVAGPARRTIERLPAKIGIAVLDFMLGALTENTRRVGKPLRGELTGLCSARVGVYRIIHQIHDNTRQARVLYIDHRADVYRPR